MSLLLDVVSALMLLGGAFFVTVGGIGVYRLPDFYTRLHGAGVTDTLGAGLILLGLSLQAGFSLATVKRDWDVAKMWLLNKMKQGGDES